MNHTPWNVGDILHASVCYAEIHKLMWKIWEIAGGYWRDADEEAKKFRDENRRAEMGSIIRSAGELGKAAVGHLESALRVWDKTHRAYLDT
jgi:hypothetical protein